MFLDPGDGEGMAERPGLVVEPTHVAVGHGVELAVRYEMFVIVKYVIGSTHQGVRSSGGLLAGSILKPDGLDVDEDMIEDEDQE